jgi:hypothetical protein
MVLEQNFAFVTILKLIAGSADSRLEWATSARLAKTPVMSILEGSAQRQSE